MAADSREPTPHSTSLPPPPPSDPTERPYQGKIYETFLPPTFQPSAYSPRPPENANALPGGSTNTAGGRAKEAGLLDGLKSIKVQDFNELHQKPCVRDALLVGIGAGFLLGGGRMVFGGRMVLICFPCAHILPALSPQPAFPITLLNPHTPHPIPVDPFQTKPNPH